MDPSLRTGWTIHRMINLSILGTDQEEFGIFRVQDLIFRRVSTAGLEEIAYGFAGKSKLYKPRVRTLIQSSRVPWTFTGVKQTR
jgi:hypothetical protein